MKEIWIAVLQLWFEYTSFDYKEAYFLDHLNLPPYDHPFPNSGKFNFFNCFPILFVN